MTITPTRFPEIMIIETPIHTDARGYFVESYHAKKFAAHGIDALFVQDNLSVSTRGTLRGLHFQHPHDQGKLVNVLEGEVFDVAVDIRYGSATFGQWIGEVLSAKNQRRLWIPAGFAHGFLVLSDQAIFSYKCTDYYFPQAEHTLLWNDPEIGIDWPLAVTPLISPKDAVGCTLSVFPLEMLPNYHT